MLTILLQHKWMTGFILLFLLLSILCLIISGVIYQSMIKDSDNMSGTENKLLKQCTKKYAGYFKLNGKMVNTAVFVDKFLQKVCFLGIRISKISHISGQLMMLSILMSGVAICLSLASGDTLFQIIPYYLMSILGLYLYFSISGIVDIQEKKKVLKANLIDYLENHFAPRLEIEKENALEEGMKKREIYAKELLEEPCEEVQEEKEVTPFCGASADAADAAMEKEAELENLLEELLV